MQINIKPITIFTANLGSGKMASPKSLANEVEALVPGVPILPLEFYMNTTW